jgi:hypothetical protein
MVFLFLQLFRVPSLPPNNSNGNGNGSASGSNDDVKRENQSHDTLLCGEATRFVIDNLPRLLSLLRDAHKQRNDLRTDECTLEQHEVTTVVLYRGRFN